MVVSFHHHGELNVLVVREVLQPVRAVWPDDGSVILVTKPEEELVGGLVEQPLFKVLHV